MTLTETQLLRLGTRGLALLGGLVITATWLLAWVAPQYVILVPIAGILILLGMLVHDQPLVPLGVLLTATVIKFEQGEGVRPTEIVFGIGVVVYLTIWYGHAFLTGKELVRSWIDQVWMLWLIWGVFAGALLGLIFGAELSTYRFELQKILAFFFYFPIKGAIQRSRRGLLVVLVAAIVLGLWITIANALDLYGGLYASDNLWQIERLREPLGTHAMAMTLFLALPLASVVKPRWLKGALLGIAGIAISGLILAKYRSFWISVPIGLLITWFALPTSHARKQLALQVLIGSGILIAAALIFFRDLTSLIFLSLTSRFASISQAGSDISLHERYSEWAAVGEKILANPLTGYGWGIPFEYQSLINEATIPFAHSHNIGLSLLYKNGIIGLLLIVLIWGACVLSSLLLTRQNNLTSAQRGIAAGLFGLLLVYAATSLTDNVLMAYSSILNITIACAMISGLGRRATAVS